MNSIRIKKILILVTILAVPGFLYYLLQEKGKNRYKPLSFYGPKKVAATVHFVRGKAIPDTLYHVIPDFNLNNQDDLPVNWKKLNGKIVLFSLFNIPADGQTDYTGKAMQYISKTYKRNDLLHLLSISVSSATRPALLKDYARLLQADPLQWDLLSGDSIRVYPLISKGLFLDALKITDNGLDRFTYSNLLVLVDSRHRIRGYYDATHSEALSKLDDEIKVLIAEELRNKKDGR